LAISAGFFLEFAGFGFRQADQITSKKS